MVKTDYEILKSCKYFVEKTNFCKAYKCVCEISKHLVIDDVIYCMKYQESSNKAISLICQTYFQNSKDITELSNSQKYLLKHILKQEFDIITTKNYSQSTIFLNQVKTFTELLDNYLYHQTIKTKTELDDLVGSFRTLVDNFCMFEDIPFRNKQNQLFDKDYLDLEFDLEF